MVSVKVMVRPYKMGAWGLGVFMFGELHICNYCPPFLFLYSYFYYPLTFSYRFNLLTLHLFPSYKTLFPIFSFPCKTCLFPSYLILSTSISLHVLVILYIFPPLPSTPLILVFSLLLYNSPFSITLYSSFFFHF